MPFKLLASTEAVGTIVICAVLSVLITTVFLKGTLAEPLSSLSIENLDEKLSHCGGINILEITITEIQKLFRTKRLTSLQLTKCYLKRIRRIDPYLKSVIEINPDVESIATEMDLQRSLFGESHSKLHGIPILIKDNMGTTDKMETTAGSLALVGFKTKVEAKVVKRLRNAGAVILGKTNLDEFATFRDVGIPYGWSSRGNLTLNPYVLSKSPDGSSTGSAVATATNLAVVALGTETDGSIVYPANFASLVGLKTTIGSVPTGGIIPLSFTQDTVGPMARTVRDAEIVFNIIADKLHLNDSNVLTKNFKIGILRELFLVKSHDKLVELEKALGTLKNLSSITLIDAIEAPEGSIQKISMTSKRQVVYRHEFKFGINEYLKNVGNVRSSYPMRTLADIIKFNNDHPVPEGYGQRDLIASVQTDGLENTTYIQARETNKKAARELFSAIFEKYKLDAFVTPTELFKTKTFPDLPNNLAAIAGYPAITVPIGFTKDHQPIGILFHGMAHTEHILLRIAAILEDKIHARRRPRFLL